MKCFLICLFLFPYLIFAQLYVKGENINEREIAFITVEKGAITGQNGIVSFDTDDKIRGNVVGEKITDDEGKTLKFNNLVAIIEHVAKRGWDYVDPIELGAFLCHKK